MEQGHGWNGVLKKVEKVHKNCDVIVTHINPSIKLEHTATKWQRADTSGFFSFDGTQFLANTTAKYWIFGHSHDQKEFKQYSVQCLSNPFGYPSEWNKNFKIRSIEIQKYSSNFKAIY